MAFAIKLYAFVGLDEGFCEALPCHALRAEMYAGHPAQEIEAYPGCGGFGGDACGAYEHDVEVWRPLEVEFVNPNPAAQHASDTNHPSPKVVDVRGLAVLRIIHVGF